MILYINKVVKRKLTEVEFNDNYKIFVRLKELLFLLRQGEFIYLIKEYYILNFRIFKDILKYLIYIKILEKKIDNIQVILNKDNRTILYFSILLLSDF